MAEPTKRLVIDIDVEIHQPGINPRWHGEREVFVPPDYPEDAEHTENFVLHEIDKAVHDLQVENFDRSRTTDIIAQFDLRARVIERIIRFAPHDLSRKGLGVAILEVIHMDSEELFDRYNRIDVGNG